MLLFTFGAYAQGEPRIEVGQAVEVPKSDHSPKKAALYSAILPGLGQGYNKKYWKIPIVYAGLGTTVYFIFWNADLYNEYKTAFDLRRAGGTDKYAGIYTDENLIFLQNSYRNQRDLSIILTAVIYGLNIIDANIDAHLFDFDVSDDLSMRIEPTATPSPLFGINGTNIGMRLSLHF